MLRKLRHWLTARMTDGALSVAPRLNPRAVSAIQRCIHAVGPHVPGLARRVGANMQTLTVYSPERCRAHFGHLAAHFAGAMRMLDDTADREPQRQAYVCDQVELDSNVAAAAEEHRDRGVIIAGPHTTNYLVSLARLTQALPLTIYFRYPKRPQQRQAKERWCRAANIEPLFEPAGGGRRIARLTAALEANKTLYIPPDLPRKQDEGVPVRLLGRLLWLPAGAGVLASRTRCPLYFLTAETRGSRVRLSLLGPAPITPPDLDRREATAVYMQWIADRFADFLRAHAPLWYFWADKHWTRVLAGDPRYGRVLTAAEAVDAAAETP